MIKAEITINDFILVKFIVYIFRHIQAKMEKKEINMKIIIACDSFKGSLSSNEVAHNIITGIERVSFNNHFHVITMADGGEGTVEAIPTIVPGKKLKPPVQTLWVKKSNPSTE